MKTSKAEFGNDVTVDLSKVAAVPIDFDFQLHSFNNGNFRILLNPKLVVPQVGPQLRVRPLPYLNLVDLGGEVADMDLSARMSWYDSRFTEFKPRFGNKIYTEMDKIWHPNLFISNQILDAK